MYQKNMTDMRRQLANETSPPVLRISVTPASTSSPPSLAPTLSHLAIESTLRHHSFAHLASAWMVFNVYVWSDWNWRPIDRDNTLCMVHPHRQSLTTPPTARDSDCPFALALGSDSGDGRWSHIALHRSQLVHNKLMIRLWYTWRWLVIVTRLREDTGGMVEWGGGPVEAREAESNKEREIIACNRILFACLAFNSKVTRRFVKTHLPADATWKVLDD